MKRKKKDRNESRCKLVKMVISDPAHISDVTGKSWTSLIGQMTLNES
jgi:hypothetical protein